ncbi:MAG: hypothetical protein WC343_02805 [Bacilli bacterium]|jgi:hypothetical protein
MENLKQEKTIVPKIKPTKNDIIKESQHKKKILKNDITEKVFEETKNQLIPTIKEKVNKITEYLESINETKGLSATQLTPIFASRSIDDMLTVNHKTYTEEELAIAFNEYVKMVAKINEYTKFVPTKKNFCLFLGISSHTYNSYLTNPDKAEITQIIDDYITDTMLTSAQYKEIDNITTMFRSKAEHGMIEAQAPTIIKHERIVNLEEINKRLAQDSKVINAEFSEKG